MDIHAQITTKRKALEIGMEYYFTGKPCKRGHYAWRDRHGNCVPCQRIRDHEGKYRDYAAWMLRTKRAQCKHLGIEFNLLAEDVRLPSVCPALGIAIDPTGRTGRDHAPSIDRIDPRQGYVRGNVCVISMRANRIKSDALLDEIESIARYMRSLW